MKPVDGFEVGDVVRISRMGCLGMPVAIDKNGRDRTVRVEDSVPVREVDRPAKVGDWIIVTAPSVSFGDYEKGDFFKVTYVEDGGNAEVEMFDDQKCRYLYRREYRVLEAYQP